MTPVTNPEDLIKRLRAKMSAFESREVSEPLETTDKAAGEVVLGILKNPEHQQLYAVVRQLTQQAKHLENELTKKKGRKTAHNQEHTYEPCSEMRKIALLSHELRATLEILLYLVYQELPEDMQNIYSDPKFVTMDFRSDWEIVAIPRSSGIKIVGVIRL